MVVGEGLFVASLLTLRAVACGNVLSLSLESNLSRRFSPFPDECKLSQSHRSYHIAVVNYGGGGRIRTFEVDDGRFTVCSLWPLGNPTGLDGADYRNRTGDLLITSQLLYLLS